MLESIFILSDFDGFFSFADIAPRSVVEDFSFLRFHFRAIDAFQILPFVRRRCYFSRMIRNPTVSYPKSGFRPSPRYSVRQLVRCEYQEPPFIALTV